MGELTAPTALEELFHEAVEQARELADERELLGEFGVHDPDNRCHVPKECYDRLKSRYARLVARVEAARQAAAQTGA